MQQGGEEESDHDPSELGAARGDQGQVDDLDTPLVHREVPPPPELVHGGGVPPVQVECPLLVSGDLSHQGEEGVEEDVETCQPSQHVGQAETQKPEQNIDIRNTDYSQQVLPFNFVCDGHTFHQLLTDFGYDEELIPEHN